MRTLLLAMGLATALFSSQAIEQSQRTESAAAQGAFTPSVEALYSVSEEGPAFMLECANLTLREVRAGEVIQTLALRIDGQVHERTGGVAGSFLGGEPVFAPAQHWKMMVGLSKRRHGTKSADFGATLRAPWEPMKLTPGHHSIEFRCVGAWSAIVPFYWEPESVQL